MEEKNNGNMPLTLPVMENESTSPLPYYIKPNVLDEHLQNFWNKAFLETADERYRAETQIAKPKRPFFFSDTSFPSLPKREEMKDGETNRLELIWMSFLIWAIQSLALFIPPLSKILKQNKTTPPQKDAADSHATDSNTSSSGPFFSTPPTSASHAPSDTQPNGNLHTPSDTQSTCGTFPHGNSNGNGFFSEKRPESEPTTHNLTGGPAPK